RIVDGESAEVQRVLERPEGLRRHERDVPGPLRRRTAGADDHRGRRRHSRELARGDRRHRSAVNHIMPRILLAAACVVMATMSVSTQQRYDLLLKGGHVIDARNNISAVRDLAIADGKVAAVAANINAAEALKVVDASGLYVTPGLVDIHVHVYAGTGE